MLCSLCIIHYFFLCHHRDIPSSSNPTPTSNHHHHPSVAFASIRDKIRQQRNEQASRKLTHRLVVGPDTRRASNVLAMTTPGNNPTTGTNASATTTTTKSPVSMTAGGDTTSTANKPGEAGAPLSSSSSGSGFGVEFVVADLTVTAQRLEQVEH